MAAVEAAKTAKVPAEATAVILTAAKSDADRKSCSERSPPRSRSAHMGTSAPPTRMTAPSKGPSPAARHAAS